MEHPRQVGFERCVSVAVDEEAGAAGAEEWLVMSEGGEGACAEGGGGEGEVVIGGKVAGDESGGDVGLVAAVMAAWVMVREVDRESERERSGRRRLMFLSSREASAAASFCVRADSDVSRARALPFPTVRRSPHTCQQSSVRHREDGVV